METIKEFKFRIETRIISGVNASEAVISEAKGLSARSALLMSDSRIMSLGFGAEIFKHLEDAGIYCYHFSEVEQNPRDKTVEKAVLDFKQERLDLIIALGGGSVIDAAKAFAVLYCYGGRCLDYKGGNNVPGKALPIVAVPTTAGTGSELTCWSVLTTEDCGGIPRKFGIGSEYLMPFAAVLDPKLTFSLPPLQTAATGIDALTHAIEAYTSKAANLFTDSLALEAIKTIADNLPTVVAEPKNLAGRYSMLQASAMAGIAFNTADLGATHSMSEALGGLYDLSHGVTNAIILPHVIDYNYSDSAERYSKIAELFVGKESADCAKTIQDFIRALGLPLTLKEAGLAELDLKVLSKRALENSATRFNPKEVGRKEFEELFKKAFE